MIVNVHMESRLSSSGTVTSAFAVNGQVAFAANDGQAFVTQEAGAPPGPVFQPCQLPLLRSSASRARSMLPPETTTTVGFPSAS